MRDLTSRGSRPLVSFERTAVDEATFLEVLDRALRPIERAGISYAVLGGLASAVLGRARWTHDLDLFVRPEDARRTLEVLSEAGFMTDETNPNWLYKAIDRGVLVDVLFKAKGDIYLDDEMIARSIDTQFRGVPLRVIPPEDLLVIKAIVHDEDTPRHWHDALGLLTRPELDWEYLLRRAQRGPRRVLSLLVYAQSVDHVVPDGVIRSLFDAVFDPEEPGHGAAA